MVTAGAGATDAGISGKPKCKKQIWIGLHAARVILDIPDSRIPDHIPVTDHIVS